VKPSVFDVFRNQCSNLCDGLSHEVGVLASRTPDFGSWPILMTGFEPVSPPRSDTSGENTEYQMYGCAGIALLGRGFPLAA